MKTYNQFIVEATRLRRQVFHHGTSLSAARGIRNQGPKPSPEGSEGPGHYVTPSLEKARKYSIITSQKTNQKPDVVSYPVWSVVGKKSPIQTGSEIPRKLTKQPKTTKEKPIFKNTKTGHVVMDASFGKKNIEKYSGRDNRSVIRTRRLNPKYVPPIVAKKT